MAVPIACFPPSALRPETRMAPAVTLSSAIAAYLAQGLELGDAIGAAKTYLSGAIAAADQLSAGHGPGPVHHFHEMWKR